MYKKIVLLATISLLSLPLISEATTVSRQLVKDYSFEDNSGYWNGDGDWRSTLFHAKTGSWYAELWPEEDDIMSVTQRVRIPKKIKSLQFSFWYQFNSVDYESISDDFCSVEIGNDFYDSWHPGEEETFGWEKYATQLPIKKYKGKTVNIDFTCITDYALDTWLQVDNVKLKAKVKK